jgi:polysaccharide pyruvyl transferase WcaK-like protein
MKIILHGATNGSNFGDYLFADIFWHKLLDCNKDGENLFFEFPRFGLGSYFRDELKYTHKQTIYDVLNADVLVYFSGGYFGQRTTSLKESLRRFIRYLPVGILFVLRKKPILVLGVGGGPITNKLLRKAFCSVLTHSTAITVRDEETADYFRSYGVKTQIHVTSDTAQVITSNSLPPLDDATKIFLEEKFKGKGIIFLHALDSRSGDKEFSEKIIPSLNKFLERHQEYGVIIGFDGVCSNSIDDLNIRTNLVCESIYCYNYQHPWHLCSLLNEVDMIITPKLHVGIVGSALSKSVISFPIHSEKTKRYYNQIGEAERCISLKDVTTTVVDNMLELYHNKMISLPANVIQAANKNLEVLEENVLILKSSK